MVGWGKKLSSEGLYPQATRVFTDALELLPLDLEEMRVETTYFLALSYFQIKRYAETLLLCEQIRAKPLNASLLNMTHFLEAGAYEATRQWEHCIQSYVEGMASSSTISPQAVNSLLKFCIHDKPEDIELYLKGRVLWRQNKLEEAYECFSKVFSVNRSQALYWVNLRDLSRLIFYITPRAQTTQDRILLSEIYDEIASRFTALKKYRHALMTLSIAITFFEQYTPVKHGFLFARYKVYEGLGNHEMAHTDLATVLDDLLYCEDKPTLEHLFENMENYEASFCWIMNLATCDPPSLKLSLSIYEEYAQSRSPTLISRIKGMNQLIAQIPSFTKNRDILTFIQGLASAAMGQLNLALQYFEQVVHHPMAYQPLLHNLAILTISDLQRERLRFHTLTEDIQYKIPTASQWF